MKNQSRGAPAAHILNMLYFNRVPNGPKGGQFAEKTHSDSDVNLEGSKTIQSQLVEQKKKKAAVERKIEDAQQAVSSLKRERLNIDQNIKRLSALDRYKTPAAHISAMNAARREMVQLLETLKGINLSDKDASDQLDELHTNLTLAADHYYDSIDEFRAAGLYGEEEMSGGSRLRDSDIDILYSVNRQIEDIYEIKKRLGSPIDSVRNETVRIQIYGYGDGSAFVCPRCGGPQGDYDDEKFYCWSCQ